MSKFRAILNLLTSRYFVVFTTKGKKANWTINGQLDEIEHKNMAEGMKEIKLEKS